MGVDIFLAFDNDDKLREKGDYFKSFQSHGLSRSFCHLIGRHHAISGNEVSELDQLGELVDINIQFLYDMEEYTPEWEMEGVLGWLNDDEEQKQEEREKLLAHNESVKNNIYEVKSKLSLLVEGLTQMDGLSRKINFVEPDLAFKNYFSDFKQNTGDGYIGNSLGQDMRNFLFQVEYAIKYGAKTVYFHFG